MQTWLVLKIFISWGCRSEIIQDWLEEVDLDANVADSDFYSTTTEVRSRSKVSYTRSPTHTCWRSTKKLVLEAGARVGVEKRNYMHLRPRLTKPCPERDLRHFFAIMSAAISPTVCVRCEGNNLIFGNGKMRLSFEISLPCQRFVHQVVYVYVSDWDARGEKLEVLKKLDVYRKKLEI